jgi:hypothetical protein
MSLRMGKDATSTLMLRLSQEQESALVAFDVPQLN